MSTHQQIDTLQDNVPHYFGTWSGYTVPLKPNIRLANIKERDAYVICYFENGRVKSLEKRLVHKNTGELIEKMAFRHNYLYWDNGKLKQWKYQEEDKIEHTVYFDQYGKRLFLDEHNSHLNILEIYNQLSFLSRTYIYVYFGLLCIFGIIVYLVKLQAENQKTIALHAQSYYEYLDKKINAMHKPMDMQAEYKKLNEKMDTICDVINKQKKYDESFAWQFQSYYELQTENEYIKRIEDIINDSDSLSSLVVIKDSIKPQLQKMKARMEAINPIEKEKNTYHYALDGLIEYMDGNYSIALKSLTHVKPEHSCGKTGYNYLLAVCYLRESKLNEATKVLKSLSTPNQWVCIKIDNVLAIIDYVKFKEKRKKYGELSIKLQEELKKIRETFESLTKENKRFVPPYLNMAGCWAEDGQYEKATEALKNCLNNVTKQTPDEIANLIYLEIKDKKLGFFQNGYVTEYLEIKDIDGEKENVVKDICKALKDKLGLIYN